MTAPERLFADLPTGSSPIPTSWPPTPTTTPRGPRPGSRSPSSGRTSTAEVAAVVKACAAAGVPLVPRGAGTGLSGGANAVDGGVMLSAERMDAIVEINTAERLAVVQPGVVNDHLRAAAAEQGLWYPPDPASAPWSTLGGNVATNAGGLCCVKYGVTRDYVLALEVVTAAGEVVRVGRRTAKGVAGYDLAGLMVGSEGTLGVITEVTVRLRPLRTAPMRTVVGFFDTLSEAGRRRRPRHRAQACSPPAFELIDRACLRAVNAWKNTGLPEDAAALLLAQTDLPEPAAEHEAMAIHDCFVAAGASDAMRVHRPRRGRGAVRRAPAGGPGVALGAARTPCSPRTSASRAASSPRCSRSSRRSPPRTTSRSPPSRTRATATCTRCLVTPKGDLDGRDRAHAAFHAIIDAAIDMGGTVTGEHGVGLLKRAGMQREVGPVVLAMQRAIKHALDPRGHPQPRQGGRVSRLLPLEPPDKVALRFGPPGRTVELTYRELVGAAGALVPRDRRVRAGWPCTRRRRSTPRSAWWPALLAGVPAVPFNPKLGERELAHVLADAAPGAGARRTRRRAAVRPAAHRRRHRPGPDGDGPLPPEPPAGDPALVIYTSGTTGTPKGAVLSRQRRRGQPRRARRRRGRGRPTTCSPTPSRSSTSTGWCSACSARCAAAAPCTTSAPSTRARSRPRAPRSSSACPTQYHRLADQLEGDPDSAAAIGRSRLLVSGSAALTTVDHERLPQAHRPGRPRALRA